MIISFFDQYFLSPTGINKVFESTQGKKKKKKKWRLVFSFLPFKIFQDFFFPLLFFFFDFDTTSVWFLQLLFLHTKKKKKKNPASIIIHKVLACLSEHAMNWEVNNAIKKIEARKQCKQSTPPGKILILVCRKVASTVNFSFTCTPFFDPWLWL